jgi:hypothetical protein
MKEYDAWRAAKMAVDKARSEMSTCEDDVENEIERMARTVCPSSLHSINLEKGEFQLIIKKETYEDDRMLGLRKGKRVCVPKHPNLNEMNAIGEVFGTKDIHVDCNHHLLIRGFLK